MTNPSLNASFLLCDDVRHEANGKLHFIGVYADKMFFPKFPARLNGLVFVCRLQCPKDAPPEKVRFHVRMPGGEISSSPEFQLGNIPPETSDPETIFIDIRVIIRVNQPRFTERCRISVVAEVDGAEIPAGSVLIATPEETSLAHPVPIELVMLAALNAQNDPAAREAITAFLDMERRDHPAAAHETAAELLLTMGEQSGAVTVFATQPINDWNGIIFKNVPEGVNYSLIEQHPYYARFQFPAEHPALQMIVAAERPK